MSSRPSQISLPHHPKAIPCETAKGLIEEDGEPVEQSGLARCRLGRVWPGGRALRNGPLRRHHGGGKGCGHSDVTALLQATLAE